MADMKFDEKEMQKREEKSAEEKSAEEKSYDEKWRRDPVGTAVWASILIWAGLVFMAENLGLLDQIGFKGFNISWDTPFDSKAWSIFFLGAGVIVLIEVAVRLIFPEYRRRLLGTIIWAGILFSLGLGNWTLIWPLILIALGVSIILRGFLRKQE